MVYPPRPVHIKPVQYVQVICKIKYALISFGCFFEPFVHGRSQPSLNQRCSAMVQGKKMAGTVPPPGSTFVRLRTKTSADSLSDSYVTPPRKVSPAQSTSNSSSGPPSSKSLLGEKQTNRRTLGKFSFFPFL